MRGVPGVPGCAPAPTAPGLASFLSSGLLALVRRVLAGRRVAASRRGRLASRASPGRWRGSAGGRGGRAGRECARPGSFSELTPLCLKTTQISTSRAAQRCRGLDHGSAHKQQRGEVGKWYDAVCPLSGDASSAPVPVTCQTGRRERPCSRALPIEGPVTCRNSDEFSQQAGAFPGRRGGVRRRRGGRGGGSRRRGRWRCSRRGPSRR